MLVQYGASYKPMSKNTAKTKSNDPHLLSKLTAELPGFPDRVGLPAKDSIIDVTTPSFPQAAPQSRPVFRIIHTTETDEYEPNAASPLAFAAAALPVGDSFQGQDRKAAK